MWWRELLCSVVRCGAVWLGDFWWSVITVVGYSGVERVVVERSHCLGVQCGGDGCGVVW